MRTTGAGSEGDVGKVFGVLGIAMTTVGVILVIVGLVTAHSRPLAVARTTTGAHAAAPPSSQAYRPGAELPGGILLFLGLIFGGVGIPLQRSAAKARRIALTGTRAQAEVQSSRPTGMLVNHVRQYAIVLLVEPPGGAEPYRATVKVLGVQAEPGTRVAVRIDPEDPKSVILDSG